MLTKFSNRNLNIIQKHRHVIEFPEYDGQWKITNDTLYAASSNFRDSSGEFVLHASTIVD